MFDTRLSELECPYEIRKFRMMFFIWLIKVAVETTRVLISEAAGALRKNPPWGKDRTTKIAAKWIYENLAADKTFLESE